MARKIAQSGGVVVIGLGRFGKSLADELERDDIQVLAIDNDPKRVQDLAGRWTHVVQADSTDIQAMQQLGVGEFSKAVIGIGHNLEASVLTAFVLRKLGVSDIWAKAITTSQGEILSQVGVAHVVRPSTRWASASRTSCAVACSTTSSSTTATRSSRPPRPTASSERRWRMPGCARATASPSWASKSPGQDFSYATPTSVVNQGDLIIVSGDRRKVELFSDQE